MLGGALSAVVTYHDTENRPKGGICVANHTTPIDVLILACDNAYSLVSLQLIFYGCTMCTIVVVYYRDDQKNPTFT